MAGSQAQALIVIHKSVRVEIFRGIRVIPSLLEKEVSRKVRKGAKKSDFLCAFASLRETCAFCSFPSSSLGMQSWKILLPVSSQAGAYRYKGAIAALKTLQEYFN